MNELCDEAYMNGYNWEAFFQYYLEQHLQEMVDEHKVKNRGCAILMNAKTGAIYALAQYPSFDLNNPYKISEEKEAEIKAIKNEAEANMKLAEARETQWRNKCITEVYEPGSVFKVITSAAAFEENLIDLKTRPTVTSVTVTEHRIIRRR